MSTAPQQEVRAPEAARELTASEINEQLERVLLGDAFRRSRRLQRFLKYITELTLRGEESRINEYLLGVEVFERGPKYNPGEDSVVRRQAHTLRQKLDEYYHSQGAADPIRIEVPLGHYVPVFSEKENSAAIQSRARRRGNRRRRAGRTWNGAEGRRCVGCAGACVLGRPVDGAAGESGAPLAASQVSPAVAELWTSWLQGNRPPVICFSSPLSGIVKQFTTPLPDDSVPLRYSLTNQLERAFRQELGLSDEGYLYITPGTDEVKSGEARGAVRLADLFARSGLTARTTRAHLLDWDDFRQDNLILMGHNEQNQWVDPLLEPYPLQLQSTEGGRQRRIVKTDPRPGEPEFFEIHYPAQGSEVTLEYALVSMLSSPDGLHELLLLSGLNTQATLMGIEFLTTKERVEDLLQRLKSEQPERSAPWKFQLVLSADVRDQTPTRGSVELIRIID